MKVASFEKKALPLAAKLPRTSDLFEESVRFLREKVLPEAAKLPGTSGVFKNKSDF